MRKRNRYHKKAKIENNELNWAKFRKIRNKVTQLIRKSKADYDNKIIDKVNDNTTPVKTWFELAKQLRTKQVSSTIPTLIDNNIEATTDLEKA